MVELCDGCTKVFIDINGTRVLEHVAQILTIVQRQLKPGVIVVKSRTLHELASSQEYGLQ